MPENRPTIAKLWTIAHAILGRNKPLTSSIVTVAPNGSFNHISVLNIGRSAVLNRWHDDGRDDSLVLSRLPNWLSAESAKKSVTRAWHESELIKVIFDKSADTWRHVSLRAPPAFPFMAERDVRSLPGQTSMHAQILLSRNTSRKGLSEQSIKDTSIETQGKDLENINTILQVSKRQDILRI
jgi:hypothetical protein